MISFIFATLNAAVKTFQVVEDIGLTFDKYPIGGTAAFLPGIPSIAGAQITN